MQPVIQDLEVFLALAPEELGYLLLQAARTSQQNGMFHPGNMGASGVLQRGSYPHHRQQEVDVAVSEGWNWLSINGLIVPASGGNGINGWRVFSRRGSSIADEKDFQQFREAAAFPKTLLHPAIADAVWLQLSRGKYDVAVFLAFRAVEEAVRKAGGYDADLVGVKLMRTAFNLESGPLSAIDHPVAEREGLMNLFVGAIQSYKNPQSHRTVGLTDHRDAQEMVLLASHLLRIVDARRPK